MQIVQIAKFPIDTDSEVISANRFLETIPAENVLSVNYATDSRDDGGDIHNVVIVYKK